MNGLKIDELLRALFRARYSQRLLLVVVEVARVAWPFAFGQEGRFHLLGRGQTSENVCGGRAAACSSGDRLGGIY